MRISWIGGWGVAPEYLRRTAEEVLPTAVHTFLPPDGASVFAATSSECVVGWSLGAWHILNAAAWGVRYRGPVLLLAPFVSFCSEDGMGGRAARAQVRWLRRWMERDPQAALADFYSRAGLESPLSGLPYELKDLLDGLDALAAQPTEHLINYASRLPQQWRAVVGASDPLLNASQVARSIRGCAILPGVGHAPNELIRSAKGFFDEI